MRFLAATRLVIFGERHLRHLNPEFAAHYHPEHHHQGLGSHIIMPTPSPSNDNASLGGWNPQCLPPRGCVNSVDGFSDIEGFVKWWAIRVFRLGGQGIPMGAPALVMGCRVLHYASETTRPFSGER